MIRTSACASPARANLSDLVAGVNSQLFSERSDFRNLGSVTGDPSFISRPVSAWVQDVHLTGEYLLWFRSGLVMSLVLARYWAVT
jgi:hypothetical protein